MNIPNVGKREYVPFVGLWPSHLSNQVIFTVDASIADRQIHRNTRWDETNGKTTAIEACNLIVCFFIRAAIILRFYLCTLRKDVKISSNHRSCWMNMDVCDLGKHRVNVPWRSLLRYSISLFRNIDTGHAEDGRFEVFTWKKTVFSHFLSTRYSFHQQLWITQSYHLDE